MESPGDWQNPVSGMPGQIQNGVDSKMMPCSAEVAEILVKLLATGLLRIRVLGWAPDLNPSAACPPPNRVFGPALG